MIDPRFMGVIEWTDRMAPLLSVQTRKLLSEEEWKDWALHVLQVPSISRYNPPSPLHFDDWREWAIRFNQVVPVN